MDQVEKAFNGRYREVNRETQQWYTYNHQVPEPRPGVVSTHLLPSAGQPVDTDTSVLSSDLHTFLSSILTDNRDSNRAAITPHLFLDMILIKQLSFPGRLITAESLKESMQKKKVVVQLQFVS